MIKDETLQTLKSYIEKDWPEKRKINIHVRQYNSYKDELSSHVVLLLEGNCIIVPSSM